MGYVTFTQNNSGGSFDIDEERGITVKVVIEADTIDEAVSRAMDVGIYFDGCESGIDCECCGDRWTKPFKDELSPIAEVYGQNIREQGGYISPFGNGWGPFGKEVCIHSRNGELEWYGIIPK